MRLFDEMPYLESERLILREFQLEDAPSLEAFAASEAVNRYLPTFLYEQKYADKRVVIERMREECFDTRQSIMLAICLREAPAQMIGIAEMYNLGDEEHKVSIGCRLAEEYWGQGIAPEVVGVLKTYLFETIGLDVITAHVMIENVGSEKALMKCGFKKVAENVPEDWGFPEPVLVDKFVCLKSWTDSLYGCLADDDSFVRPEQLETQEIAPLDLD